MRHEKMAGFVEIEAPLIAAAVGENLKLVPHRMIAPDAGMQLDALVVGRARLADERVREDALVAIEPAVRPPAEAVERLVRVLIAPAIEQHLRLARRGRPRPSG